MDERYFENCLTRELVKSKGCRIFTRGKLQVALNELKLQMNDIFDPETAQKLGRFVGADTIFIIEGFIGSTRDWGQVYNLEDNTFLLGRKKYNIQASTINVQSAEIEWFWNVSYESF